MMREFLFTNDASFASCHAASLARVEDGFVAVWFGGTAEGRDDVAIWSARREDAAGWTAPVRVAKVRDDAHWNPVLFAPPGNALHLFFKVGKTISDWETWTQVSRDDGRTWSAPRELVPGDRGGRGPVKNQPIVLSDGAWLAPASWERGGAWDVFVDRSENGGATWHASERVRRDTDVVAATGVIQPALWESSPKRVHMLMRSRGGRVCRSDSDDGGQTWSPARATTLPNNNSGIDVCRLADGLLVLAYNPVAENWGPRTPLSLAVSRDSGASWRRCGDLETGEGQFSYPSIVPDENGVAVVYTWKRLRIAFARISRAALERGTIQDAEARAEGQEHGAQ